jgi:hypothetical protein
MFGLILHRSLSLSIGYFVWLQVEIKSDDLSKEVGGDAVVLDSEAETASVKLDGATLKKGNALLTISYTGTLNTNMAGFYRE